jgi:hypothetical protein
MTPTQNIQMKIFWNVLPSCFDILGSCPILNECAHLPHFYLQLHVYYVLFRLTIQACTIKEQGRELWLPFSPWVDAVYFWLAAIEILTYRKYFLDTPRLNLLLFLLLSLKVWFSETVLYVNLFYYIFIKSQYSQTLSPARKFF